MKRTSGTYKSLTYCIPTARMLSVNLAVKMTDLNLISESVLSCKKCTLGYERTNAVPGNGNPSSRILFIGEAPGRYEDEQGLPFVGRAGRLLDSLLESINLNRSEVFITNMLKCSPPKNRDPLPDELKACGPYLDKQIEIINPKIIVTLGRFSFAWFFPEIPIGEARGNPINLENGTTIFPMYHPAAALRNGKIRGRTEQDFLKLQKILNDPIKKASGDSKNPEETQIRMF